MPGNVVCRNFYALLDWIVQRTKSAKSMYYENMILMGDLHLHFGDIGTNAGKNHTFDHIAFFIDKNETGLPKPDTNRQAGLTGLNGYDYGVFDFVVPFSQVLRGTGFFSLSKSQQSELL